MTAGAVSAQAGESSRRSALFARLLKIWRENQGLSPAQVVDRIGWDKSRLSRLETGARHLTLADLKTLLAVYGFRDDEFGSLLRSARDGDRDWWTDCPHVTGDEILWALLELAAPRILAYQPQGVPPLLQAPGWAVASARLDPEVPDGGETAWALALLARQDIVLARKPCPPKLHAVLGERFPAGTVDTRAMGEQAEKIRLAPGNVTVRFIGDADAALAAAGPFTIALFGAGPGSAVHVPGPAGGTLLTGPDKVAAYTELFWSLDRAARLHRAGGPALRGTRS